MDLSDRVVVVTGGGGLLGSAFVRAIVAAGGGAVAADINLGAAQATIDAIGPDANDRAIAVRADITDTASVDELIRATEQRFGRVDAVVNNAYPRAANYGARLEDVSYENFCQHLDMHLGGYFLVAQRFALAFKRQQGGHIINMASIYGVMAPRFSIYAGTPMTTPVEYAAIKSAVVHLTYYFAQYFKGHGIRVNCVSPGGILAGQPQSFLDAYNGHCSAKGMLQPQDVTGTLLFLLSSMSQYVTGQNIIVDDGFSL